MNASGGSGGRVTGPGVREQREEIPVRREMKVRIRGPGRVRFWRRKCDVVMMEPMWGWNERTGSRMRHSDVITVTREEEDEVGATVLSSHFRILQMKRSDMTLDFFASSRLCFLSFKIKIICPP